MRGPLLFNALFNACLLALFLLSTASLARERKTYTVPFHTVNGLILLDTGAQTTIISPKLANIRSKDSRAFATVVQGVRAHADLVLSADLHYSGDFYVIDFTETSKQAGAQIDGLLGENILRDFSAVRIDYKAQTLELQQ